MRQKSPGSPGESQLELGSWLTHPDNTLTPSQEMECVNNEWYTGEKYNWREIHISKKWFM